MQKAAKLAVVFVFAFVSAGAIFSIFPTEAQLAGTDTQANSQANEKLIAERVGKDDGYSLVVDVSGDLEGSLETCG